MNKKTRPGKAKRPLWMKLTIVGGVLFALFFILFWVFLYSPFEGEYEGDLVALIPPDIQFLIRKTNIRNDFEDFPEPMFWERWKESAAWKEILRSPEWANFERLHTPEQQIADIRAQVNAIPLVSFDRDVLGQDAVISGFFHGKDLEQTRFLIATRVSASMKIMFELLGYGTIRSLLSLPSQDLGAFMEIQPPLAPTPYYLHRDQDLVLLTNDRGLMERSLEIKAAGPQESMAETVLYNKRFTVRGGKPDNYADFFALAPNLIDTFELLGDPRERELHPIREFFFKMLNPESFEYARGFIAFDNPAVFQGVVSIDERRITPAQRQLGGGERLVLDKVDRGVLDAASWFPQRTAVFSALSFPPSDFLQLLFNNMHPDTQKLLRDVTRDAKMYQRPEDLFSAIARHLDDNIFFGLFPQEEELPAFAEPQPHLLAVIDSKPGQADQATQILNDFLTANQDAFENDRPTPYELAGVRYYRVNFSGAQEGLLVCYGAIGDRFVLSTHPAVMDECIKLSRKGEKQLPLARTDAFERGIGRISGEANFFLFMNGRPFMKLARQNARFLAWLEATNYDQVAVRAEEVSKLRKIAPYNQHRQLPRDLRAQFDAEIEARMTERLDKAKSEGFGQANAIQQANLTPWDMMRGTTIAARVSENDTILQIALDLKF